MNLCWKKFVIVDMEKQIIVLLNIGNDWSWCNTLFSSWAWGDSLSFLDSWANIISPTVAVMITRIRMKSVVEKREVIWQFSSKKSSHRSSIPSQGTAQMLLLVYRWRQGRVANLERISHFWHLPIFPYLLINSNNTNSEIKIQGGYSQNFLRKFVKISITLGLNILSFLRLKVLFWSNYHSRLILSTIKYLFLMWN